MDKILLFLQDKYNGNWLDMYYSLRDREMIPPKDYERVGEKYKDLAYITLLNENYPDFLKKWYQPPFLVVKRDNKYYYVYGEGLKQEYELIDNEKAQKHYEEKFIKQFEPTIFSNLQ